MNIKFLRGTLDQYLACSKSADTLYFITDTGALYLGEKLIGKDFNGDIDALEAFIGALPAVPEGASYTTVIEYINWKAEEVLKAAQGGSNETAASVKLALDNYKTENDARVDELEGEINNRVEKVEGYSLVADTEIARLAEVDNYDDTAITGRVETAEGEIDALQEQIKGLSGAMHFIGTYDELPAVSNSIKVGDEIKNGDTVYYNSEKIAVFVPNFLATNPEPDTTDSYGIKYYSLVHIEDGSAGRNFLSLEVAANGDFKLIHTNPYTHVYVPNSEEYSSSVEYSGPSGYFSTIQDGIDFISINSELSEETGETFVSGDVIAVGDKEYVFNGTEFVEFGDISAEGERLTALEQKVVTIEEKPAYGITATQISNWDNEVGAKALAESKTTTAEVKEQIEAYGYATEADLTLAEGRIAELEAIDHDAYAAADTALKTELEGKIADGNAATLEAAKTDAANKSTVVLAEAQTYADGKVTALADGQVATNKNDIASIVEMLTWGEF